jgi:hypothetical protein
LKKLLKEIAKLQEMQIQRPRRIFGSSCSFAIFSLLLPLLLLSCSKQSHWAFDQVHSDKKEFRSTKLTYCSRDPIYGIDLEFLNTEEHLRAYFNIHSIPIPPHKGDPKTTLLTMEIKGETLQWTAYRLAGGQRFLLPEEATAALISALKNRNEVLVTLTGYRTLFRPEDFASQFEKLLHPFRMQNPFQNPFHLPF